MTENLRFALKKMSYFSYSHLNENLRSAAQRSKILICTHIIQDNRLLFITSCDNRFLFNAIDIYVYPLC